ncbi:cyclophilin, putative [Eimeria maxima]|uniref:Cyclophilin, putative n=1 Tax=Eimeria maxima TaxID=5804 RepID=U6M535_EIMMA|nr:cyclophilin, putative [Eimeria maxima]CDJ59131.1 cyclophilin, putative [Eimeria maxima]
MSEVYVHEPQPTARVVISTTMGPLDVDLWAREAPMTVRSFLQLSLEGYYNNTIFHRLIPGFIIQGGDPTGTGRGGSSIYDRSAEETVTGENEGEAEASHSEEGGSPCSHLHPPQPLGGPPKKGSSPWQKAGGAPAAGTGVGAPKVGAPPLGLELNSRLKFRYRGLMGAATLEEEGGGPPRVGSQFFFTLGRADSLNGRYTVMGRVGGPSLFNLLRMGELPVDKHDRPVDPPKILSIQVLRTFFDDIRVKEVISWEEEEEDEEEEKEAEEEEEKRPQLAAANTALLSFAEDDDDLQLTSQQQQQQQQKRKGPLSAHDLLEDPKLSKEAPINAQKQTYDQHMEAAAQRLMERVAAIAAAGKGTPSPPLPEVDDSSSSNNSRNTSRSSSRSSSRSRRSRSRSRSRSKLNSRGSDMRESSSRETRMRVPLPPSRKDIATAAAALPDADLLSAAQHRRRLMLLQRQSKSSQQRQAETLEKLKAFRQKLQTLQKPSGKNKLKSSSSSSSSSSRSSSSSKGKSRDKALEAAKAAAERAMEPVRAREAAMAEEAAAAEEEDDTADWLQTGGLSFPIDSNTAYQFDAAKDNLVVSDPLRGGNSSRLLQDPKQKLRDKAIPYDAQGPRDLKPWW